MLPNPSALAFMPHDFTPQAISALLESLSARDRRALAIRFLRSEKSIGELVRAGVGSNAEAEEARKTLAAVALMVRQDAPEDLRMTDPALYQRLRDRITHLRMSGWIQSGQ
jgi:hypothetical protein